MTNRPSVTIFTLFPTYFAKTLYLVYGNAAAVMKIKTKKLFVTHMIKRTRTRPGDCSAHQRLGPGYRAVHLVFTAAPHST